MLDDVLAASRNELRASAATMAALSLALVACDGQGPDGRTCRAPIRPGAVVLAEEPLSLDNPQRGAGPTPTSSSIWPRRASST
jgi:hypothetical protein